MAYTKRIVCLANSYKHGGVCIAGREITPQGYGPWIRPVSARPTQELFLAECHCPGHGCPRLLDIVDIAFHSPAPLHHQVENHLIDPAVDWTKQGQLPLAELDKLWQHPATLWSNTDRTASGRFDCISQPEAFCATSSLFLLKIPAITVEVRTGHYTQRKQFRCKFRHATTDYNLSLTDQIAREYFDREGLGEHHMTGNPSLYLTISLTEPYREDGRCHKLVAAILGHATILSKA